MTTGEISFKYGTAVIELREDEFSMLSKLQSHWQDLAILLQSGVFEFKNGMAEIHRDADGKIREINTKIKRFRS